VCTVYPSGDDRREDFEIGWRRSSCHHCRKLLHTGTSCTHDSSLGDTSSSSVFTKVDYLFVCSPLKDPLLVKLRGSLALSVSHLSLPLPGRLLLINLITHESNERRNATVLISLSTSRYEYQRFVQGIHQSRAKHRPTGRPTDS
jgi:hypothetical protein